MKDYGKRQLAKGALNNTNSTNATQNAEPAKQPSGGLWDWLTGKSASNQTQPATIKNETKSETKPGEVQKKEQPKLPFMTSPYVQTPMFDIEKARNHEKECDREWDSLTTAQ